MKENSVLPLSPVEKLGIDHDLLPFDCGREELNRFLKKHAMAARLANSAQTYVTARGRAVAGYYSLAAGAVQPLEAPVRVSTGLGRHPVPVMILARLAVDLREQGRGLVKALLKDALLRAAQVADIAGIRAVFVAATDEAARAFYERFDFDPSSFDPRRLFLLMKDLKKILRSA